MQVNILDEKKRKIIVEIEADKGLSHALKQELWNDEAVTTASVIVEHPQTSLPKLVVETNTDKEPKEAIKKAIDRLKKKVEDFKGNVQNNLK